MQIHIAAADHQAHPLALQVQARMTGRSQGQAAGGLDHHFHALGIKVHGLDQLRVVGGPIPKSGRVFVDVSRSQTFGSMFAIIESEAKQVDATAVINADLFELVELDMTDETDTPDESDK